MSDDQVDFPPLTVVPTPIGNLGDLTKRGEQALGWVDLIACEDTRRTRQLLSHLGLHKPLMALHDHNERQQIPVLMAKLQGGQKVALVSDAGLPGVADPGYRLLNACIEAGIGYTVLPGPSALLTALVASGLPPHPFRFGGFLPVKKGKRRVELLSAVGRGETSIYFESPHRLPSTLDILNEVAPWHLIVVARELSKKFETIHRGSVCELREYFGVRRVKGEIVLLTAPAGLGEGGFAEGG